MDYITVIGLGAAGLTTFSFVPQVLTVLRTRNTKDISLVMYILFCTGITLWLIYGVMLSNIPMIAANLVTLILASVVLMLKIKYG